MDLKKEEVLEKTETKLDIIVDDSNEVPNSEMSKDEPDQSSSVSREDNKVRQLDNLFSLFSTTNQLS